ncbi:MAG: diguanylate cyclase [Firmicutes bacterium]|nr:diguanylate cyclase [Bacillota bacterium]
MNAKQEPCAVRNLLDKHPDGLGQVLLQAAGAVGKFACDPFFTMLDCTDDLIRMLGMDQSDFEQMNFQISGLIHPDDLPYVVQETQKAALTGEPFTMQHRLCRRGGEDLWVSVRGVFVPEKYQERYPVMYLICSDITALVDANRRLELEAKRYKAFTELLRECFFEFDAPTRQISFFGTGAERWQKYGVVDPHGINRQIFYQQMEAAHGKVDTEMRMMMPNGSSRWFHIAAREVRDHNGLLQRIIGTFRDIQLEKDSEQTREMHERQLRERAERDAVTGLFNRAATEKLVNLILSGAHGRCACMELDIDNFKSINDTCGHLFGDCVLRGVADVLRSSCRSRDVAGRIGGDEMFLLLSNLPEDFHLEERMRQILEKVQRLQDQWEESCPISVSIGAAIPGADDNSFQKIYQRVDRALYRAKSGGKNRYVMEEGANVYSGSCEEDA